MNAQARPANWESEFSFGDRLSHASPALQIAMLNYMLILITPLYAGTVSCKCLAHVSLPYQAEPGYIYLPVYMSQMGDRVNNTWHDSIIGRKDEENQERNLRSLRAVGGYSRRRILQSLSPTCRELLKQLPVSGLPRSTNPLPRST